MWYPDYSQAQPVARRDNRPMLLYFWDWLGRDTARLDTQVFPNPRVAAAMRRTINVRLEQGWFRDLARRYDVSTAPTFILTDPDGVEQSRLSGVPTPKDFIDWLNASINRAPATRPAAPADPVTTQPATGDPPPASQPLTSQPTAVAPSAGE